MKKKLLLFNGGLQTKLAPHLVEDNQATECINVDLSKGSIYPKKGLTQESVVDGIHVFQEDDTLISNADPLDIRSYARFGNRIYWTDGTFNAYGLSRYDGTNAGVEAVAPVAPDGTITNTLAATSEGLSGDYVYTYTYVDTDGIESAPSAYMSVTTTGTQHINLTIGTETNAPADIATRKIYRTGGVNPTFNLIAELTTPTLVYTDTTRDIDVSRIELSTFANTAPQTGLTNLIENNGTFWASVGDRIYFSSNGQPEYWSDLDFLQLNDECTGIGKFADVIVALTRSDAYVIGGYDRDTVAINKLPYREGCVNHQSIANVGDFLVWVSKNGVCVFNGSTVTVATRNLLSWNDLARVGASTFDELTSTFDANLGFDVTYGLALQGKYYGVYSGGVGVLRIEDVTLASMIEIDNAKSIYYDDVNNYLTVVTEDSGTFNAKSIDTDSANPMTAIWKTGEMQLGEGYDVIKQFRRIKFDVAPLKVTATVMGRTFVSENNKDFFLPSGFIGNWVQLEIETDKEIRSCNIEYGVLNG